MASVSGCQKALKSLFHGRIMTFSNNRFPLDQEYFDVTTSGCDEVGRGCLAGPVVTACVSWIPEEVADSSLYTRLRDSKELSGVRRMAIFQDILSQSSRVRVAVMSHMVVDRLNVLRASLKGFEETAPSHSTSEYLFVDGNQRPPRLPWARTVIKGENQVSAIAGASVVAKVIRDEWMHSMAAIYPEYGFDRHVGYPTAQHKAALQRVGPCPLHRKSFKPVKPFVVELSEDPQFVNRILMEQDLLKLRELWAEYNRNYFHFSPGDDRRIFDYYTGSTLAQ